MNTLESIANEQPLLKQISPQYLSIFLKGAVEQTIEAGEFLFRKGHPANRLFLIESGEVVLQLRGQAPEPLDILKLAAGEVVGWSWLFPPFVWHFDARAAVRTRVVVLSGASLLVAAEKDHHLGHELMKLLSQILIQRLQATRKRLLEWEAGLELPLLEPLGSPVRPWEAHTGDTIQKRILEHPFMRGIPPEHLESILDATMPAQFETGELIFREGDVANRFYLIEQGKVVLEASREEGGNLPIQLIGPGDVLGWSWLYAPCYWHFDARAVEPVKAIFFYGARLREYSGQNHDFGFELMKRTTRVLIQRLEATQTQLLRAEQHARKAGGM